MKVLTTISILLNIAVIALLVFAFLALRRIAGEAADTLGTLSRQTISYNVRIDQSIPVRASVPFRQEFNVPINQTLPVDANFELNPTLPVVGPIQLQVPVKSQIPVKFNVPVSFSATLPVNADIPVRLDVPVQIRVADTELRPALERTIAILDRVAGR